MTRSIQEAISAGTEALARAQSRDGSFPFWRATTTDAQPSNPLFSTACIIMGEAGVPLPAKAVDRAVFYILRQRRRDRLWAREPEAPPDSDTTACALAALIRHGDPTDFFDSISLLRSFWRGHRGPFRTSKSADGSMPERDDPVVNCNIIHALRLLGPPGIRVAQAAALALMQRSRGTLYYCSRAAVAHAARRAGLAWSDLPDWVTTRPTPEDFLGCAQWLCASPAPDEAILTAVLAAQQADGTWPAVPWVTADRTPRPVWGSPAISTAIVLEALQGHVPGRQR